MVVCDPVFINVILSPAISVKITLPVIRPAGELETANALIGVDRLVMPFTAIANDKIPPDGSTDAASTV